MPYPGQFHRLVLIGNLYADRFNTTLSIVPSALGELGMPQVDAPTLASVASAVQSWFATTSGTGPKIYNCAQLTSIKLNRIGADGRYVDNEAMEHIYTTPVAGGISTGFNPAAQLSSVTTLKTALERGRGSRGRMYLPPTQAVLPLGADGRVTAAAAIAQAEGVVALITSLNSIYTLIGRVGVASNAGAGRFEHVTAVAVGRTPDTMRSRRTSIAEDYQEVDV